MEIKKPNVIPARLKENKGITLVGLIAFIITLIIVITVALLITRTGRRAACEITVKHDLRKFVEAQEAYLAQHDEFSGKKGDVISKDPEIPSNFQLEGFTASPDVVIRIVSDDPLIVTVKHSKAPTIFEYNFNEKTIKMNR